MTVFSALPKLGTAGSIGVLLGLSMVWWVGPATVGGTGLLILVCVALSIAVSGILSWALARRTGGKENLGKLRSSHAPLKRHK